ncbi:Uncharacterised protein [Mycobacterium tuberculosis]|uniref:Uncharacterized protein n=1 Tax=Mycobacterium tuberculosis TaxID=1773 RepID=A0A916LHG3_MYCTX|nr:Uncharacterised protein [Mycobacterium tuberculosis]
MDAVGNVVGNQGGHADAKVDILTVFELRGHPCGHLVSAPARGAHCRTVSLSIFLAGLGT